jgi:hypothetical protein
VYEEEASTTYVNKSQPWKSVQISRLNLSNIHGRSFAQNTMKAKHDGGIYHETSQAATNNENSNVMGNGALNYNARRKTGGREQCYNDYDKVQNGMITNDYSGYDGLEEASRQLTLDDFAPNFMSRPAGQDMQSDRSKARQNFEEPGSTPASAVNDSGSENRLSELVRLVDKRKKMIQDRERSNADKKGNNLSGVSAYQDQ